MNSKLTNYQTHLIYVLRYVCGFLERNNISYFLAYGTMLGAVRHHGIIPWDDDADVFVPREDYERLLKMQDQLQSDGYDIISLESEDSYLTYAKIYDNKTSLWEVKQYPKMIGVFVDIFPLDYADSTFGRVVDDVKKFTVLSKKYCLANSVYSIRDLFFYLKEFHIKTALLVAISFFLKRRKRDYYKEMMHFYKQLQKTSGKYLVDYSSAPNVKDPKNVIYDAEWFDDYIMMQFQDFSVRVPRGYDEYLKCRYGDYMKLPSLSERIPQHSHYYLDMTKRVSIDDATRSFTNRY